MTFKPVQFRRQHGYDTAEASDDAAVLTVGPSMTVQAHAEDADINVLMTRFGMPGLDRMPLNVRVPEFGDFTQVMDYHSAMKAIEQAKFDFMQLPPKVRLRFGNDPQQLLEFVSDGANLKEAQFLGLLKERVDVSGAQGSDIGVGSARGAPGEGGRGDPPAKGGADAAPGSAGSAAAGKAEVTR